MQCNSCGTELPVGVAYCPACGVVTPYNVSASGVSPYDLTAVSSPYGTPQPKPATDYGSPPYGGPVQNPYAPLHPYDIPPPPPPPPPPRRQVRMGLLIGVVVLVLTLTGAGSLLLLTQGGKNNPQGNISTPTVTKAQTTSTVTTSGTTPPASPTISTIPAPNDLITPGILMVGSDTTYPPQEYIDSTTNHPAGFDIDLITAIAQRMGLQAKIVTTKFDTIIGDLVAKRFDVVISAVSITPDRQKAVDFVPYFNAGESLLVQAGNPKNITSLADLCGQSVGVQQGTIEQSDLQAASNSCKTAGKPAINLVVLQDQTAIVQLLAKNRVVATYQDSPVADYYTKLNPGQFGVGGSVIGAGPEGIVVRKGDTFMFSAIQAAFKAVKADGTYHNLILKWGLTSGEISMVNRRPILA